MRKRLCVLLYPAALLACLLLGACRPAVTGVSSTALVRTNYPAVQVDVTDASLMLQGYGRRYVSLKSDILVLRANGAADFAIYGDERDGPLTRHVHTMIVRPTREELWRFTSDGWRGPRDLWVTSSTLGDMNAVDRVSLVDSAGDWFSLFWTVNGREVPERWLARRWSASPNDDIRVIAEYREPWPSNLDPETVLSIRVGYFQNPDLAGFLKRSEQIVTASRTSPDAIYDPARPSLPLPSGTPNMTRLAGEVEERDRGFRRPR